MQKVTPLYSGNKSKSLYWIGTVFFYYVVEDNSELLALLPLPLEDWDDRHVLPCLFWEWWELTSELVMLGNHSINWALPFPYRTLLDTCRVSDHPPVPVSLLFVSSICCSSVWKTPPVTLRLLPQSSDIFNHDLLVLKDAVPCCHLSPEWDFSLEGYFFGGGGVVFRFLRQVVWSLAYIQFSSSI